MKNLPLLAILLSISSTLCAMHRSRAIVTDYQPTVAVLGDSLQNWCNKDASNVVPQLSQKKLKLRNRMINPKDLNSILMWIVG